MAFVKFKDLASKAAHVRAQASRRVEKKAAKAAAKANREAEAFHGSGFVGVEKAPGILEDIDFDDFDILEVSLERRSPEAVRILTFPIS